jgi:hypothetical protein
MGEAQIARLGAPAWKKAILRALARYGGYVGDTGGPGFAVMLESSTTYTSFGRPDPLTRMARASLVADDASVDEYQGRLVLDLADGVDWRRYLRVVPPPRR